MRCPGPCSTASCTSDRRRDVRRTAVTTAVLLGLPGLLGLLGLLGPLGAPAPAAAADTTAPLPGLDVSGYQGNVDWPSVAAAGATFAYVKATESTDYVNGYFAQQYNGAAWAGLIRGAY